MHHRIESFKPKFRHFHILSIKTALFVDKPQLLMVPSMKTAIFVDSKRFCTGSVVDLVRGTNCPPHGNHAEISARKSYKTYRFPWR